MGAESDDVNLEGTALQGRCGPGAALVLRIVTALCVRAYYDVPVSVGVEAVSGRESMRPV